MSIGNDTFNGTDNSDTLTADQGNDTLIGGLSSDTYAFDTSIPYGKNLIIDDNGIITIDGSPLTITATQTPTDGIYIHTDGTDYFILTRTDSNGELDINGNHLTVTINGTLDTATDNFTIENFDFTNGGFGITLNTPTTSTFTLNTIGTTNPTTNKADIAALENGNFIAFWDANANGTTDIGGQLFNPYGEKIGDQFFLHADDAFGGIDPEASTLSNGNVLITWSSFSATTSSFEIAGQILDTNAQPVGGIFPINTNTPSDQIFSNVVNLNNGDFLVTWLDRGAQETPSSPLNFVVKGQQYDVNGNSINGELTLADPEILVTYFGIQTESLSNNNILVITQELEQAHITISDLNNNTLVDNIPLIDESIHGTNFRILRTETTQLNDGNIAVLFEYDSDTESQTAAIQIIDQNGVRVGNEITLSALNGDLDIQSVDIITLTDGSLIATWEEEDPASNTNSIKDHLFQQILPDGTLVGTPTILIPNDDLFGLGKQSAHALSDNKFIVVWHDISSANQTISANIYDSDGNPAPGELAYLPIFGTDNADTLTGTANDDIIIANDGDDSAQNDLGNDIFDGGEGNDTVLFSGNIDDYTISADGLNFNITSNDTTSPETDTLISIETLEFADGTLVFDGTGYVETAANNAPTLENPIADQEANVNDSFIFTVPTDTFDDIDGDTLEFSATLSNGAPLPNWLSLTTNGQFSGTPNDSAFGSIEITVTAEDGNGGSITDTFTLSVGSTITGTNNADTLNGTSVTDMVLGLEGDDVIVANDANDTIDGGLGHDTLHGNAGHDLIMDGDLADSEQQFKDELIGGTGNDTLIASNGKDTLDGGEGNDIMTGGLNADIFTLEFEDGATDTITDFNIEEDLIDISSLDFSHIVFFGDLSITQVNNDAVVDLGGHTLVLENINSEELDYSHFEGILQDESLFLFGTRHDDSLTGAGGNDYISGRRGNDTLEGEGGNDFIRGGLHKDLIFGHAGDDLILGGFHNDTIDGGAGNDFIRGGIGKDVITGGTGADTMKGGWGADRFVFNSLEDSTDTSQDYIKGFSTDNLWFWWLSGQTDVMDLSAIDSIESLNDLTISYSNNKTYVSDNNSDFSIALKGTLDLNEDHFLF